MSTDLLATLASIGRTRLLVVGDLMLDRYTWGNTERISQEAPVLVFSADRSEHRLGGAANVCQMARGLGAEVVVAGVVGNDAEGRQLEQLLATSGVDCHGLTLDNARPSTLKERYLGRAVGRHAHQVLRVDREIAAPIGESLENELLSRITESLERCQAVLIADYAKGVCTERVLRTVVKYARNKGLPVLVDPRRTQDVARYRGATVLKPNRVEAELASGLSIRDPQDALAAGQRLLEQLELDAVVVTLDSEGMALVLRSGLTGLYPTRRRDVYDITGAGDLVFAVLGICQACGVALTDALPLANVAAGLEVEKLGAAVVDLEELRHAIVAGADSRSKILSWATLSNRLDYHRLRGDRIVLTNGCFDLLHVGHLALLEECAVMGDVVVAGLNNDASVRRLKGPGRPIIGEVERARMLGALSCVNYVVVFGEDTPHELLRTMRPDVLVKGGTYGLKDVIGREIVEAYGGRVAVTSRVEPNSTSRLIRTIHELPIEDSSLLNRHPAACKLANI